MKSLRTNLIIYFTLLIVVPLGLVVAMLADTFQSEVRRSIEQQTANILFQARGQIQNLGQRAERITEYNNDILKQGTVPLVSSPPPDQNKKDKIQDIVDSLSKQLPRDIPKKKGDEVRRLLSSVMDTLPSIENLEQGQKLRELLKSGIMNTEGLLNIGAVNLANNYFVMAYQLPGNKLGVKETISRNGHAFSRYWKEGKNSDGKNQFLPSPWQRDDYQVENRVWYRLALADKPSYDLVWTPLYVFKESRQVGVTASKAVNRPGEGERKPFAIVFADLSMVDLTHYLKRLRIGKRGRAFVIDSDNNRLIASSYAPPKVVKSEGTRLELAHIADNDPLFFDSQTWNEKIQGQAAKPSEIDQKKAAYNLKLSNLITYSYRGESYFARCLYLESFPPEKWQFWVVIPERDFLEEFQQAQNRTYLVALVAIAIAIAISLILRRQITRDLDTMVDAFEKVGQGDLSIEVNLIKPYIEVELLSISFNTMVRELREKAHMEKLISKGAREKIKETTNQTTRYKKLKLGGKRKFTTVFFSDIRGFTAFSEYREPEEVITMLNTYLNLQAEILDRFHGDIDKFVGDEIVAIFDGVDGPLRAVGAALEIMEAIGSLNESKEHHIQVGIGINCGEVVSGYMGSEGRADYTVIGDVVNTGARLCSHARGQEVIISQKMYDRLKDNVEVVAIPNFLAKGKSHPVTVYRVKWLVGLD